MNDNQILFQTNQFFLKNRTLTNLTNLYSFKFDCETKTRVHLADINSQHVKLQKNLIFIKKKQTFFRFMINV